MQFFKSHFLFAFFATACAQLSAQVPHLTKDINQTYLNGYPTAFCEVNGYLYFNGTNVTSGTELWRSDGTTAGTKLFADIVKGPSSSDPVALTKVGKTLFLLQLLPIMDANFGNSTAVLPLQLWSKTSVQVLETPVW